jgi:DnaJ family protein A protein 2
MRIQHISYDVGKRAKARGRDRVSPFRFPMSSFYTMLGIHRRASLQTIKSTYRDLARRHHPDKGGDPEVFKGLNEAYATLSDPEKRSRYDFNSLSLKDLFWTSTEPFYVMDPVNTILPVVVSMEDICRGADIMVRLSRTIVNERALQVCTQCSGTGVHYLVQDLRGGFVPPPDHVQCVYCTAGYIRESIARTSIEDHVVCTLPIGCPSGILFGFAGKGDQHPGTASGDLIVRIEHAVTGAFQVRPNTIDLTYLLDITPYELCHGFTRSILHPAGRYLYICSTEVTHPGVYVIPDQGLHLVSENRCGHLYLQIKVTHCASTKNPPECGMRPNATHITLDETQTRPPTWVCDVLQENNTRIYGGHQPPGCRHM